MSAHEALKLAFGESDYSSVICIGKHKQGQDGIVTYAYIPSSKIDINKINIKTDSDFYITANTLTRKERKSENLFSLKNIVIDIDCHNSELDDYDRNELLEDFLFRIKRDLELPPFNIVHFTGRGLQLWYCLEEIAGVWSFLYKDTVEKIIDALETLKEEYYNQWLLVNAKRKAIDFCRKAYQVHEVAASMCSDEDGGHLDNAAEWLGDVKQNFFEDEIAHKITLRELTGKLFEDLANKNSEWYEIMMRTVVEGESTEEVARALGISIGNLRAKKHRMKKWIKENFKEIYEESGLFH